MLRSAKKQWNFVLATSYCKKRKETVRSEKGPREAFKKKLHIWKPRKKHCRHVSQEGDLCGERHVLRMSFLDKFRQIHMKHTFSLGSVT
jgi:hypothetical protein